MFLRFDRRTFSPAEAGDGGTPGGGETGGGGQSGDGGTPGGGQPGGGGWMESLDAEVRTALEPKAYATPNDLAKAYLEQDKVIGRKGVIPPGESATDEDWKLYHDSLPAHMRAPESPDKYELGDFQVPEGVPWSDNLQSGMLAEMHAMNLPSSAVSRLMKKYAELQMADWDGHNATQTKQAQNAQAELDRAWGNAKAEKLARANALVNFGFGDNLEAAKQIQLKDGSYFLDHPMIALAMGRIADEMGVGEDGNLPAALGSTFNFTPAQARAEITKLTADKEFQDAFLDSQHKEHKAAVAKMQRLHAAANAGG